MAGIIAGIAGGAIGGDARCGKVGIGGGAKAGAA
jgi:hypothetical protein